MNTEDKLLKLRKLADAMYYAAQYLTTDASRLHKAMDEYHKFIIHECKEEPVSEDLEEAANNAVIALVPSFGQKYSDGSYVSSCRDCLKREELLELFKAGANWQKQKDKSKVLTEEQCRKIRDDAFELGKDAMKQQMIANAIDTIVKVDAGGYPYIPQVELYDYDKDIPFAKEGDKYKVILIKED